MRNITIRKHDEKWYCLYDDNIHFACVEREDRANRILKCLVEYGNYVNVIKRLIFAIEKLEGNSERTQLTHYCIKEGMDLIK